MPDNATIPFLFSDYTDTEPKHHNDLSFLMDRHADDRFAIQVWVQPQSLTLGLSRRMKHIPEYLLHRYGHEIALYLLGIFRTSLSTSYRELLVLVDFPEKTWPKSTAKL